MLDQDHCSNCGNSLSPSSTELWHFEHYGCEQSEPPMTTWGEWKFRAATLVLIHKWYEIDLERVRSSAQMLDWVFQVKRKSWASSKTVYDLIRAFDDIFYPQGTFCSFGVEKATKTSIRKCLDKAMKLKPGEQP